MIKTFQIGDRKAFETIIELHYEGTFWYAKSLTRNETLAKDLTQEVFLKLWKKRSALKDGVVIKGWLYKSVRNKFLDHIKKYKKETHLLETTFADTLDTVLQSENQDDLRQKVEIIEKEILNLPKKCHKVFLLSKKEGLTNIEIADYLGISVKTVEGHLTNALKILREKLYEKFQLLVVLIHHIKQSSRL